MKTPLIQVNNLKKYFPVEAGIFRSQVGQVKAVDGVSFSIRQGETLGLVGESGCGKTTLGKLVLGLLHPTAGEVLFRGEDIFQLQGAGLKEKRRLRTQRQKMQVVFQDPAESLDPRMRAGHIVGEPLVVQKIGKRQDRVSRINHLLKAVGLDPRYRNRFPHQFSGGERQRIGIARALATRPDFVVCDEPVSALDLSVQAQVINLLMDLQGELNLTYLFIAHDLRVIECVSDRIMVMYLGKLVEVAGNKDIYASALHPYTKLLVSLAKMDLLSQEELIAGDVPSSIDPPSGCRFHTRCPQAEQVCREAEPPLEEVGPGHLVACHKV